jgi:hypothetical protein
MAGVISHIYIAKLLLNTNLIEVDNEPEYLLGSIAPDAVMSKKSHSRNDKKISHLSEGISSDDWYLDEYRKCL